MNTVEKTVIVTPRAEILCHIDHKSLVICGSGNCTDKWLVDVTNIFYNAIVSETIKPKIQFYSNNDDCIFVVYVRDVTDTKKCYYIIRADNEDEALHVLTSTFEEDFAMDHEESLDSEKTSYNRYGCPIDITNTHVVKIVQFKQNTPARLIVQL